MCVRACVCVCFCGDREEEKRLEETDSQIREKESMLLKVRETLQGYHHMRCAEIRDS